MDNTGIKMYKIILKIRFYFFYNIYKHLNELAKLCYEQYWKCLKEMELL